MDDTEITLIPNLIKVFSLQINVRPVITENIFGGKSKSTKAVNVLVLSYNEL